MHHLSIVASVAVLLCVTRIDSGLRLASAERVSTMGMGSYERGLSKGDAEEDCRADERARSGSCEPCPDGETSFSGHNPANGDSDCDSAPRLLDKDGELTQLDSVTAQAYDFDVFIMGVGSGGIRLGKALLRHRTPSGNLLRLGFAENRDYGGTCVNRGCNPKKTLVKAAGFINEMQTARDGGWVIDDASLDWEKMQAARENKVKAVSGEYANFFHRVAKDEPEFPRVFDATATVVGANRVQVAGKTYSVGALVVCTGGKPRRLTFRLEGLELVSDRGGESDGSDFAGVITSDEALSLPTKPESMLVVGGGYIATELGSFFQQVGTKVTMSVRSSLLKSFDADVAGIVEDSLIQQGVDIKYGTSIKSVKQLEGGLLEVTLNGADKPLIVEKILMAIGRQPLTRELGLETNDVALDRGGKLIVNAYGQTTAPWIYAIGDISVGGPELQPWAVRQADALYEVLMRRSASDPTPRVQPVVPVEHIATALFTTLRGGSVGLTEEQATTRYGSGSVSVLVEKTGPCDKGLHLWNLRKVIVHKKNVGEEHMWDRVLGIHLVGPAADELAQVFGIVMALNPTWEACQRALAVHPTATEYFMFLKDFKSKRPCVASLGFLVDKGSLVPCEGELTEKQQAIQSKKWRLADCK